MANESNNTAAAVKQGQDGQTAAVYMAPPGAEKEGSDMNAYWINYLILADAYVYDHVDYYGVPCFKWVSFDTQQSYNEKDIERECRKCGGGEEMLNVYREFHNQSLTKFRRTLDSRDLETALKFQSDFNKELCAQVDAANIIKSWLRAPKISETGTYIAEEEECPCGSDEPVLVEGLCADCYWEEDARIKNIRRYAQRQLYATPQKPE